MADIQGDFGNLVHGVSRQPDERKFKGQCREQINCRSNLTTGLERRGSFKLLNIIALTEGEVVDLEQAKFTIMESEPFPLLVGFGFNKPKAWDLGGVEKSVTFEDEAVNSQYYRFGGSKSLKERFFEHSTLDTMFVSNTNVVPTISAPLGTEPLRGVWIEFTTFNPGAEIDIELNGVTLYKPPQLFHGYVKIDNDTGEPDQAESERTKEYSGSYHAEALVNTPGNEAWVQYNNWVFNPSVVGEIKIIEGGTSIYSADTAKITAIEKLPPFALPLTYVTVEEGAGENKNKGYFEARKEGPAFGTVSWHEVVKHGEGQVLNPENMPHRLLRDTPDSLVFGQFTWKERQVGDIESNPAPEFIITQTPIHTINFFQNRLFMTSGESVLASSTDEYFDLFSSSAFYNVDDDPFETFASTEKINNIKYTTQHDGDFILFSQNAQFIMSGDINHTYGTAYIQTVGQYKSNLSALPVPTGDGIMFAFDYGNFAGIRELSTNEGNDSRSAQPITQHVNDYISGSISHLATSTNVDALVALSDDEPNTIFVYEYLTLDNERMQQSWSKWTAPDSVRVLWADFYEADLFAVIEVKVERSRTVSERELHFVVINWDDANTGNLNFPVKLDLLHKIDSSEISYNPLTGRSTWNTKVQLLDLVFVEDGTVDPGFTVDALLDSNFLTWSAWGDLSKSTLWGGVPFESKYVFASPVIKDGEDVAQSLERIQLGSMFIHFTQVGQVKFTYEDTHGRSRTSHYNNRRVNQLSNEASVVPVTGSDWRISIRKKVNGLTMTLHTSDITPFTVRAVEYRGEYQQRGQRR